MKKFLILFAILLLSGCLNNNSNSHSYEAPIKDGILVFTTEYCHYCKMLKPYLEKLKEEGYNVVIIDANENRELAEKFNVFAVPAVFYIKDGKVVDKTIGYNPEELFNKAKKYFK
ncbi:thioredoxin family protein [Methanocaldococcus infernus]